MKEIKNKPKEAEKKTGAVKKQPAAKAKSITRKTYINSYKIVADKEKTDSIATILPTGITGIKTIINTDPGPFLKLPMETGPADGDGETPAMVIDKTLPMEGNTVEVLPSYPGGMDALRKFLEKNLQTPTEMEAGEMVSVRVRFVVNYSGKLESFVTVLNGGEVYNKEVVRVLKKMPDWIPGKAKGENVSVYYVIPVKFTGAD